MKTIETTHTTWEIDTEAKTYRRTAKGSVEDVPLEYRKYAGSTRTYQTFIESPVRISKSVRPGKEVVDFVVIDSDGMPLRSAYFLEDQK